MKVNGKNGQNGQKETQAEQVYMCPKCLGEEKETGRLLGPACRKDYEDEVMRALADHQPIEPELNYAIRTTMEAMEQDKVQKQQHQGSIQTYWDQAYRQVQQELGRVRLPQDKFIDAVRMRQREMLVSAGLVEIADAINILSESIANRESQLSWFKVLRLRTEKNGNGAGSSPAAEVPQEPKEVQAA